MLFFNLSSEVWILVLVVVLVLENPDRFAIRLTEQNSCRTSVSFAVTESQCTEDEHDDDDSKFRNLGLTLVKLRKDGPETIFDANVVPRSSGSTLSLGRGTPDNPWPAFVNGSGDLRREAG